MLLGFLNYVLDHRLRKKELICLCDVESTMRTEYPKLDFNDRKSIQAFSKPYVKGVLLQSGFAKMLYFSRRDHCDFLLCVFLENVTPTGKHAKCGQLMQIGNIQCFDNTSET